MARRLVLFILISGLLFAADAGGPRSTHAASLTVTLLADGAPVADASCTLREAILVADDVAAPVAYPECGVPDFAGPDVITFSLPGTLTLTDEIVISGDITIVGFGQGATIITTDGDNRHFCIDNGAYCAGPGSPTASLTLHDLTLSGGYAPPTGVIGGEGGAIHNDHAALSLERVTLEDNAAAVHGGAIAAEGGDTGISDSSFSGNEADERGGAISIEGGSLTIDGSAFSDNTASTGGAIASTEAMTLLTNTTLTGNAASQSGGALSNVRGSLTLIAVSASGNTSNNGGAISHGAGNVADATLTITLSGLNDNEATNAGGAIGITSSQTATVDTTITDSVIAGNAAPGGGGINQTSAGGEATLTIERSTIEDNTASSLGGAFNLTRLDGTNRVDIQHSTVVGNSAVIGGGAIFNQDSEITLENSTLSANSAAVGAHIYNGPVLQGVDYGGVLEMRNVTLWDAEGDAGLRQRTTIASTIAINTVVDSCAIEAGAFNGNNNLAPDGDCPDDEFDFVPSPEDMHLGILADNGGVTATHLPLFGSPLIDAGDNPTCADDDQRELPRPRDGDGDAVAICDIGAVELQEPATPTPTETPTATETATATPTETATPSPEPGTFAYDLAFRWSLVTWYGPDGIDTEDALRGDGAAEGGDDIFAIVTAVFAWDTGEQAWLGFFPNAVDIPGANDLTALQYGAAYWIAISDDDGITWTIVTDEQFEE